MGHRKTEEENLLETATGIAADLAGLLAQAHTLAARALIHDPEDRFTGMRGELCRDLNRALFTARTLRDAQDRDINSHKEENNG